MKRRGRRARLLLQFAGVLVAGVLDELRKARASPPPPPPDWVPPLRPIGPDEDPDGIDWPPPPVGHA